MLKSQEYWERRECRESQELCCRAAEGLSASLCPRGPVISPPLALQVSQSYCHQPPCATSVVLRNVLEWIRRSPQFSLNLGMHPKLLSSVWYSIKWEQETENTPCTVLLNPMQDATHKGSLCTYHMECFLKLAGKYSLSLSKKWGKDKSGGEQNQSWQARTAARVHPPTHWPASDSVQVHGEGKGREERCQLTWAGEKEKHKGDSWWEPLAPTPRGEREETWNHFKRKKRQSHCSWLPPPGSSRGGRLGGSPSLLGKPPGSWAAGEGSQSSPGFWDSSEFKEIRMLWRQKDKKMDQCIWSPCQQTYPSDATSFMTQESFESVAVAQDNFLDNHCARSNKMQFSSISEWQDCKKHVWCWAVLLTPAPISHSHSSYLSAPRAVQLSHQAVLRLPKASLSSLFYIMWRTNHVPSPLFLLIQTECSFWTTKNWHISFEI